jgi:uncharacterized protein
MIDCHIHAVNPNLPASKPFPEILNAGLSQLAANLSSQLEAASVTIAFAMGQLTDSYEDPLGLNATLDIGALVPALRFIGAANPRLTDSQYLARCSERIAGGGVHALKLYLGYLHHRVLDPDYVPYYSLAADYNLPVFLHTGDTYSSAARLASAHPLTRIIRES